jgi:hypothetical protein
MTLLEGRPPHIHEIHWSGETGDWVGTIAGIPRFLVMECEGGWELHDLLATDVNFTGTADECRAAAEEEATLERDAGDGMIETGGPAWSWLHTPIDHISR